MTKNEQRAYDVLYRAIEEIAIRNDYPPAPGLYSDIKRTWRQMVRTARRARERADTLLHNTDQDSRG